MRPIVILVALLLPAAPATAHHDHTTNPTDFDHDGDVDGSDFLAIQREGPSLIPLWQQNFGDPAIPSVAIPEPSGIVLAGLAAVMLLMGARGER